MWNTKENLTANLFTPSLIHSQHRGERSTAKSFEDYELYFNSHYLSTCDLLDLESVSVDWIYDTFLNLFLTPVSALEPGKDKALIYLVFRDGSTSSPIVETITFPKYLFCCLIYRLNFIDPKWNSITRSKPEQVLIKKFWVT